MKLSRTYNSIDDLPQWNWIKVHETNNLGYIRALSSYRKLGKYVSRSLEKRWDDMYEEYMDEFGLTESYLENLEDKKKLANLQNEFILTNNKVLLNHIRIAKNRLKENEGLKGKGIEFRESIVLIEKQQGIKIDAKKISVADYNAYIKIINKNGKAD
ncbi:MAG: hypothetical protein KUG81_09845 [Gammaproteobacteria bacterium]|nr:hypothetical protein [Gammaproteobacteria bacterium]